MKMTVGILLLVIIGGYISLTLIIGFFINIMDRWSDGYWESVVWAFIWVSISWIGIVVIIAIIDITIKYWNVPL